MEFQIDPHTLERAIERGAIESEIEDVLQTGISILGKYNRLGKTKVFAGAFQIVAPLFPSTQQEREYKR